MRKFFDKEMEKFAPTYLIFCMGAAFLIGYTAPIITKNSMLFIIPVAYLAIISVGVWWAFLQDYTYEETA